MEFTKTLLLICSFFFAVSIGTAHSAAHTRGLVFSDASVIQRHLLAGNSLPSYLLPSELPTLCTGEDCCQEDDYASPYRLQQVARTVAAAGGRRYTTFTFHLFAQEAMCNRKLDVAGCCQANVTRIWMDVDPNLKVKFATLQGQYDIGNTQQDEYGFRMEINPAMVDGMYKPTGPEQLSVTVMGEVDRLCPVPDIAPIDGLCDVIIEGSTSMKSNACCPRGLSKPMPAEPIEVEPFTCQADIVNSAYKLEFNATSAVYTGEDGKNYVDYSYTIIPNQQCPEDSPNNCCSMHLSYMLLKISSSVEVAAAQVREAPVTPRVGAWDSSDANSGFSALLLEDLNIDTEDVPSAGLAVVITLAVGGSNQVPNLCEPNGISSGDDKGACDYVLHDEAPFCCPFSNTGDKNPPAPVSYPSPPPQPVCTATLSETSVHLLYYEHQEFCQHTSFSFLITNTNGPSCTKKECRDVASWRMYIRPEIRDKITFADLDNPGNTVRGIVDLDELGWYVSFPYTLAGTQSMTVGVNTPLGYKLDQVCQPGVLPGQSAGQCGARVYLSNCVATATLSDQPQVPAPQAGSCKSLGQSCLSVTSAAYGTPRNAAFTMLQVNVSRLAGTSQPATIKLHLNGAVAQEVATPGENQAAGYYPTTGFSRAGSVVSWTFTPANLVSFNVKVNGAGKTLQDLCGAGGCTVEITADDTCFSSTITVAKNDNIVWPLALAAPDKGDRDINVAAIAVPAIIIPLFVLLVLLALIVYRRKRSRFTPSDAGSEDLSAPLAGAVAAGASSYGGSIRGSLHRQSMAAASERAPSHMGRMSAALAATSSPLAAASSSLASVSTPLAAAMSALAAMSMPLAAASAPLNRMSVAATEVSDMLGSEIEEFTPSAAPAGLFLDQANQNRPLATVSAAMLDRTSAALSLPSRAASDVLIRLPSDGGAN